MQIHARIQITHQLLHILNKHTPHINIYNTAISSSTTRICLIPTASCKDANYNLIACGYDCLIKDTCAIINYHEQLNSRVYPCQEETRYIEKNVSL